MSQFNFYQFQLVSTNFCFTKFVNSQFVNPKSNNNQSYFIIQDYQNLPTKKQPVGGK